MVSGAVMMLAVMFGVYAAAVILGLPGEERIRKVIIYIIPINFGLGLFGTWLGLVLFDKTLSKTNFVRKMIEQQCRG